MELVNKAKYGRTPPADMIVLEGEMFVKFSLAVAQTAQKMLLRMKKGRKGKKHKY